MIEPPQPGFTGVVWEAREPDRLTRELSTGPGAVPMAEAGAAWGRLAATMGGAVVEYEQIIAELRLAWQSNTSNAVLERISTLRDWITDAASAAANNALRAESQAAAHQLARLTMPNAGDIAAIQQLQQTIAALGAAMGAPIRAVAASTDTESDAAKAAASRVMRSYEAATEPLALPWEQQQPPVIAPAVALESEQGGTAVPERGSASVPGGMPAMALPPGLLGAIAPARTPGAYRTPVYAQAAAVTEAPVPQVVSTQQTGTTPMVPPGAMGAGAAAAGDEEYQPEAHASVAESGDALGEGLGIVSAPAVLGAIEHPVAYEQASVPSERATGGAG
ncbi:PPE domain-containing protein [Nocardia callitridis]|uniref:PPE domain-containing protein n=1 Tax=Nocardia callitridis TaxID=648753 RepID=A0ABP9L0B2_9NOCA